MNEKIYFVICQPEADSVSFEQLTESELLKRLNEGYWGQDTKVLTEMPESYDGCLSEQGVLIIEGKIVVPQAVQTVKEYKL